ncbi:hypothetical protein COOONC_11852 [Cooperia oncophora]
MVVEGMRAGMVAASNRRLCRAMEHQGAALGKGNGFCHKHFLFEDHLRLGNLHYYDKILIFSKYEFVDSDLINTVPDQEGAQGFSGTSRRGPLEKFTLMIGENILHFKIVKTPTEQNYPDVISLLYEKFSM